MIDLTYFGYADGGYYGQCNTCFKEFCGDKRATTCKSCAEIAKENLESKFVKMYSNLNDESAIEIGYKNHLEIETLKNTAKFLSKTRNAL